MPIVAGDLLVKYSVTTGSAGNSVAGTAAGSRGLYISTTQITNNTLNNLFDDISAGENAASTVDYRCIFLHNAHATLTLQAAVVWIETETSGGAVWAIGVDTTAASALASASAQALTIASETTAPSGVTFSAPTTLGTGLSMGNLTAGQVRAVWIRRTAANSAGLLNDGAQITFTGETA